MEQLEFNLLWHHALGLDMDETHLPQKTLHNFRVRLMRHDGGRLAVCARDLYRLVDRFGGTAAGRLEEYRLLQRLLCCGSSAGMEMDGLGTMTTMRGRGRCPSP